MKTKGFTLIELLVAIAIIGILISVVVSSYHKAKEAQREESETTGWVETAL